MMEGAVVGKRRFGGGGLGGGVAEAEREAEEHVRQEDDHPQRAGGGAPGWTDPPIKANPRMTGKGWAVRLVSIF